MVATSAKEQDEKEYSSKVLEGRKRIPRWVQRCFPTVHPGTLHAAVAGHLKGPKEKKKSPEEQITPDQMACPHQMEDRIQGANQYATYVTCRRCELRLVYEKKVRKEVVLKNNRLRARKRATAPTPESMTELEQEASGHSL
jgi:hypothetical protein